MIKSIIIPKNNDKKLSKKDDEIIVSWNNNKKSSKKDDEINYCSKEQ